MRKSKSFFVMCTVLTLIILIITPTSIINASYTPTFEVLSDAVYLVNSDTGRVVYEKNADKKIYPASVTKIMTAIIALEQIQDLEGTEITVTRDALAPLEALPYSISHAGLRLGEVFTAEELLNCIIISSSSDAANTMAVYLGESIHGFAELMNEKAKEIGMTNTNFANPHGLHEENHYTTAKDLYLLAKYSTEFEYSDILMEISNKNRYTFSTNLRPGENYVVTTNFLLNKGSQVYNPDVSGIKTGTTDEAQGCLVSTAKRNDYNYILVLMGAPIRDENGELYLPKKSFVETTLLYNWAFKNFEIKTLIEKNGLATEIPVKLSTKTDFLHLRIDEDYKQLIPINYGQDSVLKQYNIPKFVNAPIKEGDFIGTMDIVVSNEVIGTINLYSDETIERSNLLYFFEIFKASFKTSQFLFSVLLTIIAAVFLFFSIMIRKKNKKKQENIKTRKNPDFTKHY